MTAVFTNATTEVARDVSIPVGSATLSGELIIPDAAEGFGSSAILQKNEE